MGLTPPGEVVALINELDFTWPDADELKLIELGQLWIGLGSKLDGIADDADTAAAKIWDENSDDAIDAFQTNWQEDNEAVATLRKDAGGVMLVGVIIIVCAIVVLVLKIIVIVQLIILFIQIVQAIIKAVATFGASLLEIPIFKVITGRIIDLAVDKSTGVIIG